MLRGTILQALKRVKMYDALEAIAEEAKQYCNDCYRKEVGDAAFQTAGVEHAKIAEDPR